MEKRITSLQNPRIKSVVRLRQRRERDQKEKFLIEGFRELHRAQQAGQPVHDLYICPELFLGSDEQELIEQLGAETYICSKQVFEKISYRDRPDGLLGVAPQHRKNLLDLVLPIDRPPFIVVAEAIEKPGNLGTILRSCDATGVDGLIVCDRCTDIFNPNVVRASTGMLFSVSVVEATSKETIAWLKEHQIFILAATPSATKLYTEVKLNQAVALAVGTEQYGLSDQWMNEAGLQVQIPMRGQADSLNVAAATTVLLYEVLRQRGNPF